MQNSAGDRVKVHFAAAAVAIQTLHLDRTRIALDLEDTEATRVQPLFNLR
jgi:hypothetical protein